MLEIFFGYWFIVFIENIIKIVKIVKYNCIWGRLGINKGINLSFISVVWWLYGNGCEGYFWKKWCFFI